MKRRKLSKDRLGVTNSGGAKAKKKNFSAIIVGAIIFIMIFSSIAIAFFNSSQNTDDSSVEYNGFRFRNEGNGWFTNINGVEYGFEYPPYVLENVETANFGYEFGTGDYILFDPAEFLDSDYEIGRLKSFFLLKGNFISSGCVKSEGCTNLPVKSCEEVNAVLLRRGENTQIYKEDNCLVLESREGEEMAVINRFMYKILGIM